MNRGHDALPRDFAGDEFDTQAAELIDHFAATFHRACDAANFHHRLAEILRNAEPAAQTFRPTHRHKKTGKEYELVTRKGRLEENWTPAAIYRAPDGTLIARALAEWDDGRFEEASD